MWVEIKRSEEGVSVTLYDTDDDGDAVVVDEYWATWTEFLEMYTPPKKVFEGRTPTVILNEKG